MSRRRSGKFRRMRGGDDGLVVDPQNMPVEQNFNTSSTVSAPSSIETSTTNDNTGSYFDQIGRKISSYLPSFGSSNSTTNPQEKQWYNPLSWFRGGKYRTMKNHHGIHRLRIVKGRAPKTRKHSKGGRSHSSMGGRHYSPLYLNPSANPSGKGINDMKPFNPHAPLRGGKKSRKMNQSRNMRRMMPMSQSSSIA
jgi:hypothetical protein